MLLDLVQEKSIYYESYKNACSLVRDSYRGLKSQSSPHINFSTRFYNNLLSSIDKNLSTETPTMSCEEAYILLLSVQIFALGLLLKSAKNKLPSKLKSSDWNKNFVEGVFAKYGAELTSPYKKRALFSAEDVISEQRQESILPPAKFLYNQSHIDIVYLIIEFAVSDYGTDTLGFDPSIEGINWEKLAALFTAALLMISDYTCWVGEPIPGSARNLTFTFPSIYSMFVEYISRESKFIIIVLRFDQIQNGIRLYNQFCGLLASWFGPRSRALKIIGVEEIKVKIKEGSSESEAIKHHFNELFSIIFVKDNSQGRQMESASIFADAHRANLVQSLVSSFIVFEQPEDTLIGYLMDLMNYRPQFFVEYGKIIKAKTEGVERAERWIKYLEAKSKIEEEEVQDTPLGEYLVKISLNDGFLNPSSLKPVLFLLSFYHVQLGVSKERILPALIKNGIPLFIGSQVPASSREECEKIALTWENISKNRLIHDAKQVIDDVNEILIDEKKKDTIKRLINSACGIVYADEIVGTGTFISPTLILTCLHVLRYYPDTLQTDEQKLEWGKNFTVRLQAIRDPLPLHENWLAYESKEDDIAVLRLQRTINDLDQSFPTILPIEHVKNDQGIFTLHYPNNVNAFKRWQNLCVSFLNSAIFKVDHEKKELAYTLGTKSGSSGAGVFNWRGELIGVHQRSIPDHHYNTNVVLSGGILLSPETIIAIGQIQREKL